MEMNTKSTQTIISKVTVSTQTSQTETKEMGIQTIETETGFFDNFEDNFGTESEEESPKDLNESFVLTDSNSDSESSDDAGTSTKKPKEISCSAFIVFWSSLVSFFANCGRCLGKTTKLIRKTRGSLLTVITVCTNGHKNIWRSQPPVKRQWMGNIRLSAAVLFSANTFTKIAEYFRLANVQWLGKTRYYAFQRKYLSGVVNEAYVKEKEVLLGDLKKKGPCKLSGDGRCDSPGHNAKYLTYSMIDQIKSTIINMSVTQVTEAGNSNRMEKMGFIKVLEELKEKGLNIEQITTDRHTGIRKYMREKEPSIPQQFDVWHFCKSIRKRLLAAAKKKCNKALEKWIRSICNHFWWCCATCDGSETLLREKWTSILFHVQNKHRWTSCKEFHKCEHARISRKAAKKKEWLKPTSDAFKALQTIVLDKNILKDLKHLTKFSHTGKLEVYHALYNKWVPKSQHFSQLGMVTRSQLATLDFNAGSGLKQAKTKKGDYRTNVGFSKVTQVWSAKPIKETKSREFLTGLVDRTLEIIEENTVLELPKLPKIPKNIAPTPKPDKKDVVSNQRSRFV